VENSTKGPSCCVCLSRSAAYFTFPSRADVGHWHTKVRPTLPASQCVASQEKKFLANGLTDPELKVLLNSLVLENHDNEPSCAIKSFDDMSRYFAHQLDLSGLVHVVCDGLPSNASTVSFIFTSLKLQRKNRI